MLRDPCLRLIAGAALIMGAACNPPDNEAVDSTPTPAEAQPPPSPGYLSLEHRGRLHSLNDLSNTDYRESNDDPFAIRFDMDTLYDGVDWESFDE